MAKNKTKFICNNCGYVSLKWLGRCPECKSWDSFVEEVVESKTVTKNVGITTSDKPRRLKEITFDKEDRITTTIKELDLVLGGGIVKGSLVLVGGDPGIGKSTILLQVADHIAKQNLRVLYISGEESVKQTKLRAERLKVDSENLFILAENNMQYIDQHIDSLAPNMIIVDSIQTVYNPDITSAPGSVSQVRDATARLMNISKVKGISTFIVGHVTKSGAIAGPKILEHMVDTVLYFEGERHNTFRILRGVKNRFGSTNEIGIFEMTNVGLKEVDNPSKMFLSSQPSKVAGSVITASMEGTRPVLIEIQGLISQTNFNMPRRMAVGLHYNKLIMLIAVLEKKVGLMLYNQDAYLNVVGGMSLNEPAVDLAVVAAIASSFKGVNVFDQTIIFGEVGLTGEVRNVSHVLTRINEAKKMGYKRCIIPKGNLEGLDEVEGMTIVGVADVDQAFGEIFE